MANPGPRSLGTASSSTPLSSTPSSPTASRKAFALTGPSPRIDPRTHAVRGDLADVRLAEQVFAPHYAAAIFCLVNHATPLLSKPDGGEKIATLQAGDGFELLELAGRHGWGVAPGPGLVGYCDRAALELT